MSFELEDAECWTFWVGVSFFCLLSPSVLVSSKTFIQIGGEYILLE